MEIYDEHDQAEALRRWWEKNGRALLIGLALGLAAVLGWQAWQGHQKNLAEAASVKYQILLNAIDSNPDQVIATGREIIADYPDSPYAAFAGMAMGAAALEQGDPEAAAAHLQWVLENGHNAASRTVAGVRLARLKLSQGDAAGAHQLIQGLDTAGMEGLVAEVRGDILLAQGERAAARAAYEEALEAYATAVPEKQPLLRMKLDDLAGAGN